MTIKITRPDRSMVLDGEIVSNMFDEPLFDGLASYGVRDGNVLSISPDDLAFLVWGALTRADDDPFYRAVEQKRIEAFRAKERDARTWSYLVSIPRESGEVFYVEVDGGSSRFEEHDSEEYAKDMVVDEIECCDEEEAGDYPDDLLMQQATCRRVSNEEVKALFQREGVDISSWG
jgi:hypothetical protein